jgi:UDP-glucose:glycoprotein glucosyltransferase
MNLRVMKRPGKENMTLLNDATDKKDGKTSSSSSSSWSEDEDTAVAKSGAASDVINVFTVASGHMYERLQKIMILSVIKNTKSR